MFVSYETSIAELEYISSQMEELTRRKLEIIHETIKACGIKSKEPYFSKEMNRNFCPVFDFRRLSDGTIRSSGVGFSNGRIFLSCFPARKDGTMATRGVMMLDLARFVPLKPTQKP